MIIQTLEDKKLILKNFLENIKDDTVKSKNRYYQNELEKESGLNRNALGNQELKKIAVSYGIEFIKKLSLSEKSKILTNYLENNILSEEISFNALERASGLTRDSLRENPQLQKIARDFGVKFAKKQTLSEKKKMLISFFKDIKNKPDKMNKYYAHAEIDTLCGLTENSMGKSGTLQKIAFDYGIKVKNPRLKKEEKEKIFIKFLDSIKHNPEEFDGKYSMSEFGCMCGLSKHTLIRSVELKKIAKNYGMKFKQTNNVKEHAEILTKYLDKVIKDLDLSVEKFSFSELEKKSGLPNDCIRGSKKLRNILKDYGIINERESAISEREKIVIKCLDDIIHNEAKVSLTYTYSELDKLCGFETRTFGRRKNLQKLVANYGIKVETRKTIKLNDNIQYIIEHLKHTNRKILNIETMAEFGKDMLNVTFLQPDESTSMYIKNTMEIFENKTNEQINDMVKDCMVALTHIMNVSSSHLSVFEIKLQILNKHRLYLNESIIISSLNSLNINTSELIADNIQKRLRYASLLKESNIVEIDYRDSLPEINTNKEGNIIISNEINSKNSFIKLWKEYAQYLINNEICGHIKRGDLENKGKLESLINIHPEYKKAFFLDDENIKYLKNLGYEGIAALAFTAMNKTKSDKTKRTLSKIFHSTNARCAGFFMFLAKKHLALTHPKYITIFGGTLILDIISNLSKNHILNSIYLKAKNNIDGSPQNISQISREHAKNHLNYLYFSVSPQLDALSLTRDDFQDYVDSTQHYAKPSSTINHKSFVETIFSLYGNKMAIFPKEQTSIIEYYHGKLASKKLSELFFKNYKQLIKDAERVITERYENESISYGYLKEYAKSYSTLFQFLDSTTKRLTRKELISYLNPLSKIEMDFKKFFIKQHSLSCYNANSSHFHLLFSETTDKEYSGAYSKKWTTVSKKDKVRKLIRNGLEPVIYETLQNIALNSPAKSDLYPFLKNGRNGAVLNTSWWEHDTSPVLAIALWLTTKLPRRGMNILNLDVNSFLQYQNTMNIDGNLKKELTGFYFNTDKNRNIAKTGKDIIPIRLLRRIFKKIELELIENYVNYIKDAYYFVPEVEYKSGGNYEKIKPLFPANDYQQTVPKAHLDAYYNKTLLFTQFKVRELAKNEKLDKYYNSNELVSKQKELSKCTLLFSKEIKGKAKKVPETIEEIYSLNYSDGNYRTYFTSNDGLHNLRGVGATYLLLTIGMSIEDITFVTGHSDDKVLQRVYLFIKEHELFKIINKTMFDLDLLKDKLGNIDLNTTSTIGVNFIDRVVTPLIENSSGCTEEIYAKLKANGFMSNPATIISNDKDIYGETGELHVENGLEIASKFHPVGNWEAESYGICTMKNRCPNGTGGICSKCPHLIFNIYNLDAISLAQNMSMLELAHIQTLQNEAIKSGTNQARQELKKRHDAKFEEYVGWIQIIQIIEEKIASISKENKKLPMISTATASRICNIKELQVDVLSQSKRLNIENMTTSRALSNISNQLLISSIKKGNLKTSEKIAQEGVDWFIEMYGSASQDKKTELVTEYLIDNVAKNDDGNMIEFKNNSIENKKLLG